MANPRLELILSRPKVLPGKGIFLLQKTGKIPYFQINASEKALVA
jgi:ribosomal protein L24E